MAEKLFENKTEEELWILYKESRNPALRDKFVRQYAPLVKYVAGKVAIGMPHNVEFDDLVGFGVFGLFDAIEKFDPEKHVKFKTYGCGSAIASSSELVEMLLGKTLEEAKEIKNIDIVEALELPPIKIHCSVLAEDSIKQAIEDYEQKQ